MDTVEVILAELREFRSAATDWQQQAGERLAKLETKVKELVGNGQPGRVRILEEDVAALKNWRWWLLGATAGLSAAVSIAAWCLALLFGGKH